MKELIGWGSLIWNLLIIVCIGILLEERAEGKWWHGVWLFLAPAILFVIMLIASSSGGN